MRFGWWLLVAVVLGATIRWVHLDAASFWIDELNTVRVCTDLSSTHQSKVGGYIPTTIALRIQGVDLETLHPDQPERWLEAGVTERSARAASCLIGILSIPLLAMAARSVIGARPAALLAIFLAVAPWHIYWSRVARFYTQQFLCYNLALIWYFRATRDRSNAWFAASMVMMILAFLSQPPALVICFVFALDWLIGRIRKEPVGLGLFGWVAGAGALLACVIVLMGDVQRQPEDWTKFVGDLYQSFFKMFAGTVYMVHPGVIFLALCSAGWLLARQRRLTLYLLAGAFVPLVVFGVLSGWSYVGLRYVFASLFCWLCLLACGAEGFFDWLRSRFRRAEAWAACCIVGGVLLMVKLGLYTSGVWAQTRWRDAFAHIEAQSASTDAVACTGQMIGKYYLERGDVIEAPDTPEKLVEVFQPVWIAFEAEHAIRGRVKPWYDEAADFRAAFVASGIQPLSSVRVYYHDQSRNRMPEASP